MAQPKIIATQLDTGTGGDALLTANTFFTTGSGRTVQAVHGVLTGMNGSTVIPFDNTAPLVTEGTEFGSAPFTTTTSGHVHFDFSLTLDSDTNGTDIVVAVFRDTTCIATGVVTIDTNGKPKIFSLTGYDNPGLGTFTYSGRVGNSVVGRQWYINSTSSGNDLGGTLNTAFILWESV